MRMRPIAGWLLLLLSGWFIPSVLGSAEVPLRGRLTVIPAAAASRDDARTRMVAAGERQAVTLREGAAARTGQEKPDLTFAFRAPRPERYLIYAVTAADEYGRSLMPKWKRQAQFYTVNMWFDTGRATRRSAFSPWLKVDANRTALGRFQLTGKPQQLHLQLPRGLQLQQLEFVPFPAPAVPAGAAAYLPQIKPDTPHPRVWVNREILPRLRANLNHPEHRELYAALKRRAAAPAAFAPQPGAMVLPDAGLETAAVEKAFVYLMEGDRATGKAAAELMSRYLDRVEFGNMLDVTREIGAAIYAGSLVYDWCYDLLTPEQRDRMRHRMLECARELEVDWPPFRQVIVNGHGNEWQMTRDLLAMAIAVYDEDPEPYRYLAWQVLEVLLPMRRFEYASPRHNQGTNYGYLRYGCDLHAAWLMERMAGRPVFDRNLFGVIDFWSYMRLPGNDMLPCGDGRIDQRYWSYPLTTMLAQAGSRSAQVKGEMMRQRSLEKFPMMALLFNDPAQTPDRSFDTLPLSIDFGPVLGGMVARTGWDLSPESGDVIAEIKGGGRHFGNHQHSDAGALQLYYRGNQIVDLGQYRFYGTPYDFGFNKRSVAHSMVLLRDPAEKFARSAVNDGGIRLNQELPLTPDDARKKPQFQHGRVLFAAFGPEKRTPEYSCFSADLTTAYGGKATRYVRSFVFWNFRDSKHPAAVILLDHVVAARPEVKTFCQFNTATVPELTADGFRTRNRNAGGGGRVHASILAPAAAEREMLLRSGADSTEVFGTRLTPPRPEHWSAAGSRVMITPRRPGSETLFCTVLQPTPEEVAPREVHSGRTAEALWVTLGDHAAILHGRGEFFTSTVAWELPDGPKSYRLLVTGLTPGKWRSDAGTVLTVEAGRHCAILDVPAGSGKLVKMP